MWSCSERSTASALLAPLRFIFSSRLLFYQFSRCRLLHVPLFFTSGLTQTSATQAEFDSSWIVDLRERPLLPAAGGRAVPATHVSPLTEEAGSVVLTDAHLYFQPLHAVAAEPVRYVVA
jgi:hypothetical protein